MSPPLSTSVNTLVPAGPATAGARRLTTVLVFLALFALGWLGGFGWQNRVLIGELWYAASEQRYLTMAGEVGPVTYLVEHRDLAALQRMALGQDDILGVEVVEWPALAAIAFRSADAPVIAEVEALPVVSRMQRKAIPMICH